MARKRVTQVRILRQVVDTLIVVLTVSSALMTFEPVRQYGISLFASAGVAGLVAGLAALSCLMPRPKIPPAGAPSGDAKPMQRS